MKKRVENLKLIKNFMLNKNSEFTFNDIFTFMKANNIDEYELIWIAKEELKLNNLIEESYDSIKGKVIFISNVERLKWSWDLAINNCQQDGIIFSNDYLELIEKNKSGEISHSEMRKRIKIK